MSRIKKGVSAKKRKRYLLKRAKGYINGANSKFRLAKERLLKAESNAYISRKLRKRDFRRLWITRINGALDQIGSDLSYSRFINLLNKSGLDLNRKSISEIAVKDINSFKKLVEQISKPSEAKSEPKKAKEDKETKSKPKTKPKTEKKTVKKESTSK